MIRTFKFDYDSENDSLFLYDPKSKSKASIDLNQIVIDYNSKKEISGVELLNASNFFKGLEVKGTPIDKKMLEEISTCNIEVLPKGNFVMIKMMFTFDSKTVFTTSTFIPTIDGRSPALAY